MAQKRLVVAGDVRVLQPLWAEWVDPEFHAAELLRAYIAHKPTALADGVTHWLKGGMKP